MNKIAIGYLGILFFFIYFLAGMIVYQYIKDDIDLTRTAITCDNPTTNSDRINCLAIDAIIPATILVIVWVALSYFSGGIIK